MGSTFIARRAGMYVAASATPVINNETAAKTTGSFAFVS